MANKRNMAAVARTSIRNEWPDHPIPGLAIYAFRVDEPSKEITLRAIFFNTASDDAKDQLWEIDGILSTHLDDDWVVSTQLVEHGGPDNLGHDEEIWFHRTKR